MARLLSCFFLLSIFSSLHGQHADSGQLIVHRHLKVIGKETYRLVRQADGSDRYTIDCFYSDRGTDVPLKTAVVLSGGGQPLSMSSVGLTSRHSLINDAVNISTDSVSITRDSVTRIQARPANLFPVGGAAPATLQWLLVNWWNRNGKPAVVEGMFGPVEIKTLGFDTIHIAGVRNLLTAIGIKNVIWGWEFLWMDQQGRLAALATINAEGDKFEFVHPEYESALLFFAQQSAIYGTRQYPVPEKNKVPQAIINGTLVDLETGKELKDGAVVMVNGLITYSGPTAKAVIPQGAIVHDARGKRILPGLWDMHAHLKQVEWGPAYLAAGITTVRDMANEFVFINTMKASIDAGRGVGPTILRAGIIDGPGPMGNGIMIAETREAAKELVTKYKQAGFEQVKLYGQLQPDIIRAICEEAHRQGLGVTGHIPASVTTVQAIDMGIDMIAHLPYVFNAFKADSNLHVDLSQPQNREVLEKLLKFKIVLDPTLSLFELVYRPFNRPMEEIEPAFNTLPAGMQADLNAMGLPPAEAEKRVARQRAYKELLLQLYNAGVPVVAGTDMMIPGYTLYRELELYVAAGLSPLQALRSATITPAAVMGLAVRTGRLQKGMQADLILVDGDPLQDISEIRKVTMVFKGGIMYDPKVLHGMIGFGK